MTQKETLLSYQYRLQPWRSFDYDLLHNVYIRTRYNQKDKPTCNDCIIFLDTETSKSRDKEDNYIVIWTITVRAFNQNIVTLYGKKPSDCVECLNRMQKAFRGHQTFIYVHNLSFDWVFLRKFLFARFGFPVYQLNTKPHYPIYIEFENGIILRDSLILAQRKLEKWAVDLDVEHKKAVGLWDYDLIRDQDQDYSFDELTYAENDTLAGAECIDRLKETLNKTIFGMPWTMTGIVRERIRKIGSKHNGHEFFLMNQLTLRQLLIAHDVYHGGYTHGNRAFYAVTVRGLVEAYDFASSYPFVMLSEKYPCEKFMSMPDCSINMILNDEQNAYMFKLIGYNVKLKDYRYPMPALQASKAKVLINPIKDNGRILECDYIEIYLNEIDLKVINDQYTFDKHICIDVMAAYKDYLPRWLTDYIYELFEKKTRLKGGDLVLYNISKAMLNSIYGLHVQFPIRDEIREDYESGEYHIDLINKEEKYEEFCKKRSSILPYQIGVWVTSYAFYNLFQLGSCAGIWLYSDTDSCYGMDWDHDRIAAYNQCCRDKLLSNGYGPVQHNGRDYWLGVAELDGIYSEFRTVGAKRYCTRDKETKELKITVAGVPKKAGAKCLKNDIENFREGFIFDGVTTGKKLHTHIFRDEIYIDDYGNEIGDSIDLSPNDYTLSGLRSWDWFDEILEVKYYDVEE